MKKIEGRQYRIETETNLDLAKLFIKITLLLKGIKLSNTEELIIAYFLSNGYNKVTREKIVEAKLVKNAQSLSNTISRFRKIGLIIQDGAYEKMCKEFDGLIDGFVGLKIILQRKK